MVFRPFYQRLAVRLLALAAAGVSLPAVSQNLLVDLPFTGSALDESGNNHHGTVLGATQTFDRFGFETSAYEFDGIDDAIVLDGRIDPANLTISTWFKTESVNGGMNLIRNRWFGWLIAMGDGELFFNTFVGGGTAVGGNTVGLDLNLNDGEWHHVAMTYDGFSVRAFVDGENVLETQPSSTRQNIFYINASTVGISQDGDIRTNFFQGTLDDFQIYDGALSEDAIAEIASNVPEPTSLAILGVGGLLLTRRRR